MGVWTSLQKHPGEPAIPTVSSTLQEGFVALARLRMAPEMGKPPRIAWGQPLTKQNVLASLVDSGSDL